MNKHREIIYKKRNNILENDNIHDEIINILKNQIKKLTLAELYKNSDNNVKSIIKAVNTFL
jgi:preprotein translocase subunit SecA